PPKRRRRGWSVRQNVLGLKISPELFLRLRPVGLALRATPSAPFQGGEKKNRSPIPRRLENEILFDRCGFGRWCFHRELRTIKQGHSRHARCSREGSSQAGTHFGVRIMHGGTRWPTGARSGSAGATARSSGAWAVACGAGEGLR